MYRHADRHLTQPRKLWPAAPMRLLGSMSGRWGSCCMQWSAGTSLFRAQATRTCAGE